MIGDERDIERPQVGYLRKSLEKVMLSSVRYLPEQLRRGLTQSLYSIAIASSRMLLIRPLVMKLRTSRLGIQLLHLAVSDALLGLRGIRSELSSINRLRLALCLLSGPR